ncbi:MAG TPA: hypothetical protein VKM55_22730 [Candidatus Lokiarchaeia archaeon]|nr:hypothetical protein [Candidatus Lokiarchaeia archaeon]
MPRPFTREGIGTRIAIRTAYEVNPAVTYADLHQQFGVMQQMIDSAMAMHNIFYKFSTWALLLYQNPDVLVIKTDS